MQEARANADKLFVAAFPFVDDVLALPVEDIPQAVTWYSKAFGLKEIERREGPLPSVIMERDDVRLGFAVNGGDASQDGAAILVTDIRRARDELEPKASRPATGAWMSATVRSTKSSLWSRPMGYASISISPCRSNSN